MASSTKGGNSHAESKTMTSRAEVDNTSVSTNTGSVDWRTTSSTGSQATHVDAGASAAGPTQKSNHDHRSLSSNFRPPVPGASVSRSFLRDKNFNTQPQGVRGQLTRRDIPEDIVR